MMQDPWLQLEEEFNAWQAAGRCASLWWRDDDAVAAGPLLERLLRVCVDTGLLLAVIPTPLRPSLPEALAADLPFVRVAQHGYAHLNHAPRGRGLGAWELGMHRGKQVVLDELDAGRERLEAAFGERFVPVLVPPWNHIDPALYEAVAARAYRALSVDGARITAEFAPGLRSVNVHCDPIRWKSGARFAGESKTINELIDHLQQRRQGLADIDEPSGFVTHHIDLDEQAWVFCEKLAAAVSAHPAAAWVKPAELFGESV